MGVEALIFGSVLAAGVGAVSAHETQAANAAAQSELNEETMAFNREEAEKARNWEAGQAALQQSFNSREALLNRQFIQSMSSSAHQREMADLKRAGLNPILAANSGASVPATAAASASLPTSSAASVGGLSAYKKENVLNQFVSSALEGAKVSNDLKRAQAADKSADAALKQAEVAHQAQVATEKHIDQQIKVLKADEKWKNFMAQSEEEKVKLISAQIQTEYKRQHNEATLTAAKVREADAIAYGAVKNADINAERQRVDAQLGKASSSRDEQRLRLEKQRLDQQYFNGKKQTEKEFYNSFGGKVVYSIDRVVGALTPIKILGE